ncbi:molybdenum cofactor guanylyltransferase [Flammeovirgaceae bacterium 311]|nr:molybdenum cofactor guanylyltransferase [Flammeovirgaceae bacterium 311]
MGRDKGLMPIGDSCWAKHVADKLESLQLPVVVSVNGAQLNTYSKIFAREQLVIDAVSVSGPLNGLLSVHQQYEHWDLLLMACDMVNMQFNTLFSLIRIYQASTLADFYVYQEESFAEPFGGIYTGRGLRKVAKLVEDKRLKNYSLRSILEQGRTKKVPISSRISFTNYNSGSNNQE